MPFFIYNYPMDTITIKDKHAFLNANYPEQPIPELEEKMICLSCDTSFTVEDYIVIEDEIEEGRLYITCPELKCKGTASNWVPVSSMEGDSDQKIN